MYIFIETPLFTRIISDYLSDDEYAYLQASLSENPTAGVVIPGSGGIRKLRWRHRGQGKRGGIRVIYHVRPRDDVVWMLTVYAKDEVENIPAHVLRKIKEEIDAEDQT